MKERIILAPGANASELMKSLAIHGVNTFNLRICGVGELARIALMRSGIPITEEFISYREQVPIVAEAVKDEPYFDSVTYRDLTDIAKAVNNIRKLTVEGDETKQIVDKLRSGIFKEKNNALISVYSNYVKLLADKKLIDTMSIVRRALDECSVIDADYITLSEYPLSPIEHALIKKISDNKVSSSSLAELFGVTASDIKVSSFKKCYGAPNEVETILVDIYKTNHLDGCTVAVTDSVTYGQLFFDYALLYNLPISFGTGIPIINSNPARLLQLYNRWTSQQFFSATAVDALLHSDALDNSVLKGQYPKLDDDFSWNTFYNMLGVLRLTNDASVNATRMANLKKALEEEKSRINKDDEKEVLRFKKKELCVPILEIYARELALPIVGFIQKYSYIRKMAEKNSGDLLRKLDNAALDVICEEIAISHELESEQSESDIIASILKMNVLKSKSEEGKLFVTTINGALSAIRENLYIAGLSSSKYPSSPREDYLLLDDDIDRFGSGASFLQSNEQIQIKRDNLMLLTSLSTALGVSINVSYAGMDVAELKKDNASSLIYELYKASNGKEANYEELEDSITSVDYFEPAISITREVGNAYNKEATITINDERITREEIKTKASLDRAFSPTAIGTFFNCPRQFFLQNIVGLYTPNDDKPFEVIATNEAGTLMHSVMEKMAETKMNLDDTLEYAGCLFDNFILEHPPLVEDSVQVERSRFLSMARYAYESDPGREVALAEEDIEAMHESGVKLHGLPDRVEKLDDGSYLVVDYKTSRKMSHEPDDVDTCFQIVVYAYLMESKGYNISGGEFRYLRLRQNIPCKYDDEMKELLNEKLVEFKKAMDNLDFPIPANAYEDNREKDDPDPCKFCKYGLVCGKLEKEGLEDE